MNVPFKTVSFGGYDKKAVDSYIDETQEAHEKRLRN